MEVVRAPSSGMGAITSNTEGMAHDLVGDTIEGTKTVRHFGRSVN
jgi:hypothetical protein